MYINTSENFKIKLFAVTGYVRGAEKIWIIGDEFSRSSFEQYYKGIKSDLGDYATFAFKNFEVREFLSSRRESHVRSVLTRIRNNLVHGFNDQVALPKLIVVVMDDDIIKNIYGNCLEEAILQIEPLINWLVREFEKLILTMKDVLPTRAVRDHLPQVLWMCPPVHTVFGDSGNMMRQELTHAIKRIVDTKKDMSTLSMIKVWDSEDRGNIMENGLRYTSQGLKNYWLSIDSAIRYWCTAICPKIGQKRMKNNPRFNNRSDKWFNPNYRRRLPTPP